MKFRHHHLLSLLQEYEKAPTLPLDLTMSRYFRRHKAIGSKDKAEISENLYALFRWKGLLDHLLPNATWEQRFDLYQKSPPESYQHCEQIPLAARLSFPPSLFEKLAAQYGEERAVELCRVTNTRAPTTVRVNLLKTERNDLLQLWEDRYSVQPTLMSPWGITFLQKIAFYSLTEFKEGFFEIQDEGSQLVSALVQPVPGQRVLDYCAGSGGKALAIAPQMQGKGQIYLHDIRPLALYEARRRLKRAGIQNGQLLFPDEEAKLKKLKKGMDWVLVDVPCSGSGTWRRNPDQKGKFEEKDLQALVGKQRLIFEKALSFLKPGGKIVYATCSLFQEENEAQIQHFEKIYGLTKEKEFKSLTSLKGMDGFYGVVLD